MGTAAQEVVMVTVVGPCRQLRKCENANKLVVNSRCISVTGNRSNLN